jgi:hypothetical protein
MNRTVDTRRSEVRNFGLSWPVIVAFAALAGTLGYVRSELLADPDTYWHIAAGQWILQHLSVPSSDPFSHSMPGAPWIAHEWLSEVLLASAHSVAGWAGPVVLAVLAFAGTLAYQTRFLLSRLEPIRALFLVALTASMLAGHLLARPHVLAWPLMALWVGTLVDAVETRRGPPWWLLGLIALWANLHGGVTLGVALGAALALEAVLAASAGERASAARRWGAFVALSIGAMMVTPSGWRSIWFTFHVMGPNVMREVIGEWTPTSFGQFQPFELWLLLLLGIALTGRLRLPWLRLLLVLGLIHLALTMARSVAVLGLVAPFLIAAPLRRSLKAVEKSTGDAERLDRLFASLAKPAKPLAVTSVTLVGMIVVLLAAGSGRYAPAANITPEAAVTAALGAGARGPVMNGYNFGGYLIFRGIPVFIDGRAEMYGREFMEKMFEAQRERNALSRMLAKYGIGWTLLSPGAPVTSVLDTMPCWRRAYADSIAVAHVRVDCAADD